jgi:hypothetical protein
VLTARAIVHGMCVQLCEWHVHASAILCASRSSVLLLSRAPSGTVVGRAPPTCSMCLCESLRNPDLATASFTRTRTCTHTIPLTLFRVRLFPPSSRRFLPHLTNTHVACIAARAAGPAWRGPLAGDVISRAHFLCEGALMSEAWLISLSAVSVVDAASA